MDESELQRIADESYDRFINDESIIGFESLLKPIGGGSRLRNKIRKIIYDKYGKNVLTKIYRSRLAKSAHKNRTPESYIISPEHREKMIDGVKKSWENNDNRRKLSRNLMIKHCHPVAWNDETNNKRIESRLIGKGWSVHSLETKEKISNSLKKKWNDGCFDNRRPTLKSKGQIEMCNILRCSGYTVIEEYRINNRPFDAAVVNQRWLFEFNGTYWHLDPRIYDVDFYDRSRDVYAWQVWYNDNLKIMEAIKHGFKVYSIWQIDWDNAINKESFIQEIINEQSE